MGETELLHELRRLKKIRRDKRGQLGVDELTSLEHAIGLARAYYGIVWRFDNFLPANWTLCALHDISVRDFERCRPDYLEALIRATSIDVRSQAYQSLRHFFMQNPSFSQVNLQTLGESLREE
jgi:hypothetical protein